MSLAIDCDEWIASEHDDPECSCDSCARVHGRSESQQLRREAQTFGGLAPWAGELLGAGWLDADGKGEPLIQVEQLAQRALGDAFAQLEALASTAREKCVKYRYADAAPDQIVTHTEALELISYCQVVLDYARVHLGYLPKDAEAAP